MGTRELDSITQYAGTLDLPDTRKIETAEVDEVLETDWPTETVSKEKYLPSESLREAVNLGIALGRPLLLQGDPGCGKTCLAFAVAYELGHPLEVAYIKSTSRAQDLLYTYDAVKRLYDAQMPKEQAESRQARDARNYIRLGPLGRAIARASFGPNTARRSVVLIDEIDKADIDFPNDLLWELDRLEFRVQEVPKMAYAATKTPALRPVVIVTHNEEKALPPAFLRRCIYHFVTFPDKRETVSRILGMHRPEAQTLFEPAIDVLLDLREKDLLKKPGLSELIDWIGYAWLRKAKAADLPNLPYMGAIIKHRNDRKRVARDAGK